MMYCHYFVSGSPSSSLLLTLSVSIAFHISIWETNWFTTFCMIFDTFRNSIWLLWVNYVFWLAEIRKKIFSETTPGLTKMGEVGEILTLYQLKLSSLDIKAKLKSPRFFLQVAHFLQIIFVFWQSNCNQLEDT